MQGTLLDLIISFLVSRKVDPKCELCGQSAWSTPDGKTGTLDLPYTQAGGDVRLPAPAITAHTLICNNCGNMRLFAKAIVDGGDPTS